MAHDPQAPPVIDEAAAPAVETVDTVEFDELVEDVSIDGMCGVY